MTPKIKTFKDLDFSTQATIKSVYTQTLKIENKTIPVLIRDLRNFNYKHNLDVDLKPLIDKLVFMRDGGED